MYPLKTKSFTFDTFYPTYSEILISIIPSFDESILDRVGSSLVCIEVVEVESSAAESVLDVVHDWSLDRLVVMPDVRAH